MKIRSKIKPRMDKTIQGTIRPGIALEKMKVKIKILFCFVKATFLAPWMRRHEAVMAKVPWENLHQHQLFIDKFYLNFFVLECINHTKINLHARTVAWSNMSKGLATFIQHVKIQYYYT